MKILDEKRKICYVKKETMQYKEEVAKAKKLFRAILKVNTMMKSS